MSIRVALTHRSSYRYDRLVSLGPQVIRLRPAAHCRTPIAGYSLNIEPANHFLNWQQDPHGNFLARAVFPEPTQEFTVAVRLVAKLTVINPFDFFLEDEALEFPFHYPPALQEELLPCLRAEPAGRRLTAYLQAIPRARQRTVDFLVDLNRMVHQDVGYLIRLEPGVQCCEETLAKGSGSCRDSAWLLVQILRHLGLAARFVSGYLIQLKPDVKPLSGPSGAEADFTDLHAWAEVFLPGAGWVGLDPTSGLLAGEGHLPLAATPEPQTAAPISGLVSDSECEFDFSMHLDRIEETPRVTRPYAEAQWERIMALGDRVDRLLDRYDVRLTMGGEPTFVSLDARDQPEWNTAALGEQKRSLAGELLQRLADRFSVGPLLHYGQGKWYPGEPLPRWALGCFWRKDHQSIWHDPAWMARDDASYGFSADDALRFMHMLAQRLGVVGEYVIPAYEDVWYYLWRERRLPTNVAPADHRLQDSPERARLARVLEQGLDRIVGYALPLRPTHYDLHHTEWQSSSWLFRAEHMFLIPGDSPLGFRLPLDSMPWSPHHDEHYTLPRDPFEGTAELLQLHQARGPTMPAADAAFSAEIPLRKSFAEDPSAAPIRTALCVEAREGILHVFMPPLGHVENYLHLLREVEQTAAALQLPVRIEGYPPPHDHRLTHFKITPDPGVIEVNLQPSGGWDELTRITTTLYDEARLTGLVADKFMLDGRHTGTGGGNHFVLGGARPADSPFLRRPDLLRSLLAFWNNHPSLSYLFSGLFIGPTSQAPRVDEARHESIYELETAFPQLELEPCPPWLVDRVLRHLLVDVTGNTHRTEFCIDKLFSPDSSVGRLGLVEFRAFEMPPHARMSLVQQLFLRGLLVSFWTEPYTRSMVRWSTLLHDQFLLPHHIANDFAEVLGHLARTDLIFDPAWFAAHFEFRFPLIGRISEQGIEVELRQALEPWHVLGEEGSGSGVSRYVDSSLERVQVKVRGMTHSRHLLTCNGRRVPLQRTNTPGEFVAGIRFRAWQPAACLHPTIGVHAPLVFELIDTWNEKCIGGCTWHVAHPGGRNYEAFPVNSYEAESRRIARFFPYIRRVEPIILPPMEVNRDYPHTLDLRRPVQAANWDDVHTP